MEKQLRLMALVLVYREEVYSIKRPSQVKLLVSKEEGWPPLMSLVPWGAGGWLAFPVIPLDCHICILGLACTPAHL